MKVLKTFFDNEKNIFKHIYSNKIIRIIYKIDKVRILNVGSIFFTARFGRVI